MLAVCSQAQLNPSCPEHVAAVWLHALVWVGNARWRGLQEAVPLEQLSRLLAGLHGYAALLQLVFGHPPAEETGERAPAAALLVHTQKHAMAALFCIIVRKSQPNWVPHLLSTCSPLSWARPWPGMLPAVLLCSSCGIKPCT